SSLPPGPPDPPRGGHMDTPPSPLLDVQFWRLPLAERMAQFAEIREQGPFIPLSFDNFRTGQTETFDAATRYAEVLEISRRPLDFCSGGGRCRSRTCPRRRWSSS